MALPDGFKLIREIVGARVAHWAARCRWRAGTALPLNLSAIPNGTL